jgi:hypothetical protein
MAHTPSRNFVFIGEVGVGKTMLINSMEKYFNYENFDVISAKITKESLAPIEKNTKTTKLHTVTIGDTVYNLLDTPGFTEIYGKLKNYEIFKEIEAAFLHLPEIHGICFVLRSSNEELTNFIEKIINNSLSVFPKKAVSNVFFIFTHANECHFTAGNASAKIRQIIRNFETSYDAKIRYSVENICLVDNLGMRLLIAKKNGLSHPPIKETDVKACWDESKKQLDKILNAASSLPGITRNEIIQCRLLKEIAVLLQTEIISSSEAKTLQNVLSDAIFKVTIFPKLENALSQSGNPLPLPKIIEGLGLLKRSIRLEELKNKIVELEKTNAEFVSQIIPERPPSPIEDPVHIPPEPVLPVIIPQPRQTIIPQQPLPRPDMPQPPPRFNPPPPPDAPQPDYVEDYDLDDIRKSTTLQSMQLLHDIAEGIEENCEQGDLTNIYASELKSIQKAVASSPEDIDLKDLSQALKVFEHNPKIGSRTKGNIREFLNGL